MNQTDKAALLQAMQELIEAAESMLGTCGVDWGDTPEDADTFFHDEWAEEFLSERLAAASLALAAAREAA